MQKWMQKDRRHIICQMKIFLPSSRRLNVTCFWLYSLLFLLLCVIWLGPLKSHQNYCIAFFLSIWFLGLCCRHCRCRFECGVNRIIMWFYVIFLSLFLSSYSFHIAFCSGRFFIPEIAWALQFNFGLSKILLNILNGRFSNDTRSSFILFFSFWFRKWFRLFERIDFGLNKFAVESINGNLSIFQKSKEVFLFCVSLLFVWRDPFVCQWHALVFRNSIYFSFFVCSAQQQSIDLIWFRSMGDTNKKQEWKKNETK